MEGRLKFADKQKHVHGAFFLHVNILNVLSR